MKRILSVFLLIAMTVSTFAILPAQAAAPITSTEEDSIVPSPGTASKQKEGPSPPRLRKLALHTLPKGRKPTAPVPLPFLFATYLPAVGFTMRWCTSTKPV